MLRMKSHFSLISSQLLPKSQSLTLDCDFVFLIWQLIHSVLKTHVVADCTGSRRLFYSKSHLSPVPSLLLSKMQTFHWFAFWFFFQCLKTVGHPAFLSILRKAGCPFLMSRKQLFLIPACYVTGCSPLALPLGELSPQVTERVLRPRDVICLRRRRHFPI